MTVQSKDNYCDHQHSSWKRTLKIDSWTGESEYHDEIVTTSTCVDLDLYMYQCTECKKNYELLKRIICELL